MCSCVRSVLLILKFTLGVDRILDGMGPDWETKRPQRSSRHDFSKSLYRSRVASRQAAVLTFIQPGFLPRAVALIA